VVYQPNHASRKPPLVGRIKRAIGNFLWFDYMYKIDRRQLIRSYLKVGDDKCRAESEVAFFEGKSI
jgi:hypothetical protein